MTPRITILSFAMLLVIVTGHSGKAAQMVVISGAGHRTLPSNPATPADVSAASCSSADVQAAINAASDGDIVAVPSGSCVWSSSVVIPDTKGITLRGAGVGATIIIDAITSAATLEINVQSTNAMTTVTGFTFDADETLKTGSFAEITVAGSGVDRFRIHHNALSNLRTRGIRVFGWNLSGVIDHNTIAATTNGASQGVSLFGAGAEDSAPFDSPLALGSGGFIFVEDNVFNFTYVNDGALDAYGGARYVFRYNTVNGTTIGHHGADTGGYRGIHSFEIYNNTFSYDGASSIRALFFRSGTGVVFSNTWTGNYGPAHVDNYRSCQAYAPWGICDGSSSWDENASGQQGGACLDMVGHLFTENVGGSNALEPIYVWNNTQNGSPKSIALTTDRCSALSTHVVDGREFHNDTSRPGYASHTYPHPLVGS